MKTDKEMLKISRQLSKELLPKYKADSPVLKKVAQYIKKNKNFVLTTHIGADADGIGSQLGLYYLLKALKKSCIIINNEKGQLILPLFYSYSLQNL